jgi:hypothetical protein
VRLLQDRPVQGVPVVIALSVAGLRCRNRECQGRTFVEDVPTAAEHGARRTRRVTDILHPLGRGMGGRPAERVLTRLGMPASDDAVLRLPKRRAAAQMGHTAPRVPGIDDRA